MLVSSWVFTLVHWNVARLAVGKAQDERPAVPLARLVGLEAIHEAEHRVGLRAALDHRAVAHGVRPARNASAGEELPALAQPVGRKGAELQVQA
jgi:hypothetical protein